MEIFLHPKIINRSCFPVPNLDDKFSAGATCRCWERQLKGSLAPSSSGSCLGGGCASVPISVLENWKFSGQWEILLWKKIAVICIFGQGAIGTKFGLMTAKPSLSISVEGTEGLQKMPSSERQDHYWVSLLINQIKGKEGAWLKHLNTLAEEKIHGSQKLVNWAEKSMTRINVWQLKPDTLEIRHKYLTSGSD